MVSFEKSFFKRLSVVSRFFGGGIGGGVDVLVGDVEAVVAGA